MSCSGRLPVHTSLAPGCLTVSLHRCVSVEPTHTKRAIGAVRHARYFEATKRLFISREGIDDVQLPVELIGCCLHLQQHLTLRGNRRLGGGGDAHCIAPFHIQWHVPSTCE